MHKFTANHNYRGKFSQGPIFAERQSLKISQYNFRIWTSLKCSAHNYMLIDHHYCSEQYSMMAMSLYHANFCIFLSRGFIFVITI